jgi:hypothetical protein
LSTICKLDPRVRRARYRRRQATAESMDAAMRSTGLQQEALVAFAHRLNAIRVSPAIHGCRGVVGGLQVALSKEQRFRNLFQQLRNT